MSLLEVEKTVHKYFWFNKTSKAGKCNKISRQVVQPPLEDKNTETDTYHTAQDKTKGNNFDIRELRIDGFNFKLSKSEIQNWIEQYG